MAQETEIQFENGGVQIGGFLVTPPPGAPRPGIVVLPGMFGLNEGIRHATRRLAQLGYAALAVDIFARIGGGPAPNLEAAKARIGRVSDAAVMGDVNGAAAYLRGLPGVSRGPIGLWGFSLGGRYAILAAAFVEKIAAVATLSTVMVDGARTAEMPASATERAQEVACPVLAIFGKDDPAAEAGRISAFRSGLAMSGQDYRVTLLPGGHNLLDASDPAYSAESADAHWHLVADFFHTHLG